MKLLKRILLFPVMITSMIFVVLYFTISGDKLKEGSHGWCLIELMDRFVEWGDK